MKRRKKSNVSEETYWKSSTDIMAGVLLIILLVMMLLMLYLTQLKKGDGDHDALHDYFYEEYGEGGLETEIPPTEYSTYHYENIYPDPPNDGGGGGGGGDDEGDGVPENINPDEGHDKTAVFVTVIDEETGNVIKKDGVLFELYADKNGIGGLQTLHTYYPEKTEYKQYQTTPAGTFFLPEKITRGWYSLHNLTAPEGYGVADDFDFEITESLDWHDPFLVEIPMSPSKNRIYVRNLDASSKSQVGGESYDVYAAQDIITLDGTVRYKSGQKVDSFECDEHGLGSSKKLYLGNYYLLQTASAPFYAVNQSKVDVALKLTDTDKDAAVIYCEKTRMTITLTDEYTGEPIRGAVYTVTGRESLTTDKNGKITLTDLEKDTAYTVTLDSVPEPYRFSSEPLKFKVDKNGFISGEPSYEVSQTAHIIRVSIDYKDLIFKNSVTGARFALYDSNDNLIDEWDAVGEEHILENLETGVYTLEVNGNSTSKTQITVKDVAKPQSTVTYIWTLWDTILVITATVAVGLIVFLIIWLTRRRKRRRSS